MKQLRSRKMSEQQRRGAAMVEFAIMLPLLVTLVLGSIEFGIATRASTNLANAVREGGRLASMEFTDHVGSNETANEKVARDIRNFATASGLKGSKIVVTITSAEGSDVDQTFDLEDKANNLRKFRISASLAYNEVSLFPVRYMKGKTLRGSTVFRASRSSLSQ